MTIYHRIKKDHDSHRELLEKLAETSGDSEDRRSNWQSFFYDVKAHAAAEEEILYANLIASQDGQPDARHSVHEHQELDNIMEELNDMDMASPGWLNRFKTLHHDYLHHIEEEENEIFERAEAELGADKSDELGSKFDQRKLVEVTLVEKKMADALEH